MVQRKAPELELLVGARRELKTQLAQAHVIDQFRNKGVRRLRIPPNGPAEVLERYE